MSETTKLVNNLKCYDHEGVFGGVENVPLDLIQDAIEQLTTLREDNARLREALKLILESSVHHSKSANFHGMRIGHYAIIKLVKAELKDKTDNKNHIQKGEIR